MAEKDLLSVVIPCYKSEKTISSVIEKEMRIFEENGISRYEFILVNDCSPDHTWETLTELGHRYPFVKCINLSKNMGQHGAIMAGFNHVSGDLVVLSDDDGQTQMEAIGQWEFLAISDEEIENGRIFRIRYPENLHPGQPYDIYVTGLAKKPQEILEILNHLVAHAG